MPASDAYHFIAAVDIFGWPSERAAAMFGTAKPRAEKVLTPDEFAKSLGI